MAPLNGGEDLDLGHISPLSNPLWAGHTIVWAHDMSKKVWPGNLIAALPPAAVDSEVEEGDTF